MWGTLGRFKRLVRRALGVEGLRAALDAAREREAALHSSLEGVREEVRALRREALVRQVLLDERNRLARSGAPAAPVPTVYVLTAHEFNHGSRGVPIDRRLLCSSSPHVFYFFDRGGVPAGFRGEALAEIDINPKIQEAGKKHLAEWSFFLTEFDRPFLRYPCAVISSRFYEKNRRLAGALEWYMELFGHYLGRYGFGYLPSYDRDFDTVDLAEYHRAGHLGTRREGFDLIADLYDVRIPEQYPRTSDFWCNYIAFRSRKDFEDYVGFYRPLIGRFFDSNYNLTTPYENIFVNKTGGFRNEKPFTLLLELVSHLYFYVSKRPYFGLHYDGFYDMDEPAGAYRKLLAFS
jgi:hypothetical protein